MKKLIDKFDTPIHHEQIRALYQQSPFVLFSVLAVTFIVAIFFWEQVDHKLLISWVVINVTLTFARVVLVKSFHRVNPQGAILVKWGLLFSFSSVLSGIIWGQIAVLFMDTRDVINTLFAVLVLVGMASGSQISLSTFLPAYFGFGVPTLLPLAVVLFNQPEDTFVLIGYMVMVFIIASLAFSLIMNRNVSESIRLRFENLDLLESLELQKDIAEKANTDKSRFLAATSHDLRQPLHAMDLYFGALKNILTEPAQVELLNKGLQSSAALGELLAALMDVSRLDAGDVVVDRGVVNVDILLQTICDEYQEKASCHKMVLEFKPSKLLVESDELMLGRMLRNLVNNACTHSEGTHVALKAERVGEQVLLTVCDDGKGIPEPQQRQVFSEFYQLNNPERDRNKGLGLGLAIVKRLARLLHHELHLESAAGGGCSFKLRLPFAGVVDNVITDAVDTASLDVSGLFVILIDDEADIRNAMRTLLLQWGCELLVADSLKSLQRELAEINYPQPDVLLCDYRLRENQNGLEVVIAMRQYFNTEIPALIISGDTDKVIEVAAVTQGCDVLHKPIRPERLRTAIYNLAALSADA
ncbi:MAG: hybrid sensor histidine kinase/response regulator [Gammaproteobacteria bacterium]|nr:hybrid sensor histidine kinase/response regulator [Gammaproteobacteria bacterium]MCF6230320.1 hybrid sensor histidine kinase/response regulator [Gammaproteobacteria bacterium]